jgi:hypothetical protein
MELANQATKLNCKIKMKYLFVVCVSFSFVGAVRVSVETKVNITVSIVKKLYSSGICFVHSGQEGKSRSAAKTFQLTGHAVA